MIVVVVAILLLVRLLLGRFARARVLLRRRRPRRSGLAHVIARRRVVGGVSAWGRRVVVRRVRRGELQFDVALELDGFFGGRRAIVGRVGGPRGRAGVARGRHLPRARRVPLLREGARDRLGVVPDLRLEERAEAAAAGVALARVRGRRGPAGADSAASPGASERTGSARASAAALAFAGVTPNVRADETDDDEGASAAAGRGADKHAPMVPRRALWRARRRHAWHTGGLSSTTFRATRVIVSRSRGSWQTNALV